MKRYFLSLALAMACIVAFASPRTLDYATGEFSEIAVESVPIRTMTETAQGYEATDLNENSRVKENPNRTIREDRIWEYAFIERKTPGDPKDTRLINMRFSGTTEINGKTYNNCYICPSWIEFIPDPEQTMLYCYAREENGKIYTLWQADYNMNTYYKCGMLWGIVPDNYSSDEVLSYDFSLKDGETYKPLDPALFKGTDFIDYFKGKNIECEWEAEFKGYEKVGEDLMPVYDLLNSYDSDRYLFTAVEGVGRVSGFCNFMPMPLRQYRCTDVTMNRPYTLFNNLYDLEGNVLYAGANLKYEPGVDGVGSMPDDSKAQSDVYGIDGTLRMRNASLEDIDRLEPGVYIVGGKKVMIRR